MLNINQYKVSKNVSYLNFKTDQLIEINVALNIVVEINKLIPLFPLYLAKSDYILSPSLVKGHQIYLLFFLHECLTGTKKCMDFLESGS